MKKTIALVVAAAIGAATTSAHAHQEHSADPMITILSATGLDHVIATPIGVLACVVTVAALIAVVGVRFARSRESSQTGNS